MPRLGEAEPGESPRISSLCLATRSLRRSARQSCSVETPSKPPSLLDVRGTYTLVRISKGEDGAETLETFVTEVVVPAVPAVSGSKTKDSEGNEVEVAEVPEVPATGVEEDGVTPKKVEVKVSR